MAAETFVAIHRVNNFQKRSNKSQATPALNFNVLQLLNSIPNAQVSDTTTAEQYCHSLLQKNNQQTIELNVLIGDAIFLFLPPVMILSCKRRL